MCELTFVGCPSCNARATDMTYFDTEYVTNYWAIDEDGDRQDIQDNEYSDGGESGFKCDCGWTGSELDDECSDDYCECRECVEPDPSEEGDDPDEIVCLIRRNDSCRIDLSEYFPADDVPAELRILLTDRTIHKLPMPRWRSTELWNEHLSDGAFQIAVDFEPPPDRLVQALMLNYEETEAHIGAE